MFLASGFEYLLLFLLFAQLFGVSLGGVVFCFFVFVFAEFTTHFSPSSLKKELSPAIKKLSLYFPSAF